MTPETYMAVRHLADRLIASCDGGHDDWETINDLSHEQAVLLDSMALECQVCNQWFAAADMIDAGQWECSDCNGK